MTDKHAVFSPSASNRWINCPASIEMSKDIPGTTSTYAHEGTVCHWVAARCQKDKDPASKYLGEVVEDVRMTQELIDAIQMYIDEVNGLAKEHKATGGRIEFEVEINDDCWGTLDMALWNDETLIAGDLKMGKGVIVEVEKNSQLMIYAIGMIRWLQRERGINPSRIILYIFQPRTVNPVRKWEISREDLLYWFRQVLKPAIEEVKSGVGECKPGESQCRWCPASANCTAQAEHAIKSVTQAFAPFTEEAKPEVEVATGGTLSIEGIAKLLPSFKHVKNWMKELEAYALTQALGGHAILGHKVVAGKSNRKWNVDEVEIVGFIESKGFEAYGDPPLLSPAKVEKAMGKKESKAHGLGDYIHKPPGAPTLVQDTDKRPAIDTEAEKELSEAAISIADALTVGEHITVKPFILTEGPDENEKPILVKQDDAAQAIEDMFDDPVVVVSDEADASALTRMMAGTDDSDLEVFDEVDSPDDVEAMFQMKAEEEVKQTATSGSPVVVLTAASSGKAKPPKAAKRLKVLAFGKNGAKLDEVASVLGTGINNVKLHLRYLNERDGYGYAIYSDGTFKITE